MAHTDEEGVTGMSRDASPSREVTAVYCATRQNVCGFKNVEQHAFVMTFTLTCSHTVTLQPGTAYGLDVKADSIIVYPNRADLPSRRDADWPLAPFTPEDFPAGFYLASYREAEQGTWFRQEKIRLVFEIIEPVAFATLLVSLFATLKRGGRRPSIDSKYYRLWVQANGGPPQRGQRMTPRVFRGYWQIRVDWGRRQTGEPSTPKVAELLERVAGGG